MHLLGIARRPCRKAAAQRPTTKAVAAKQQCPHTLELTLGNKVMATQKLETDLDITKWCPWKFGTVVDVILHPDELRIMDANTIVDSIHFVENDYVAGPRRRTRTILNSQGEIAAHSGYRYVDLTRVYEN
ncbi:hypothetical protein EDD16DRAFT_1731953 [Pisolithus croceorrhizus]|nr:hypothetical protein EDD16DRAFT_1731953 [Pisolithus croceorrhizus]